MNTITYEIYSEDDISTIKKAEMFYKKTIELKIEPEYMSLYEPVNKPFDFESAVKLWCEGSEGEDDSKYGSMIARNRRKSITYMIEWHNSVNKNSESCITYWVSAAKYKKYSKELFQLYQYIVEEFNATYAYITHSIPKNRQYYPHNRDKLTGVFWCNYYGKKLIDWIGKDKIDSYKWFDIYKSHEGYYTFLSEKVWEGEIEDPKLEERAKEYLGKELFISLEDAVESMHPEDIKSIDFKLGEDQISDLIENISDNDAWIIDMKGNRIESSEMASMERSDEKKLFIIDAETELDFDPRRETVLGCAKLGFLNMNLKKNQKDDCFQVRITYYDEVKYEGVEWYCQPLKYEKLFLNIEKHITEEYVII